MKYLEEREGGEREGGRKESVKEREKIIRGDDIA